MGTFLDHALKSSEGPAAWLDFFSLTGSAFALLEKCPPVPDYKDLSKQETFRAVTATAKELDVHTRLQAFSIAVDAISKDKQSGNYHLVVLDPIEKMVTIKTYGRRRLNQANKDYTEEERRISRGEPIQAVLVSAGPIDALRRAYPNYFLDTRAFIRQLNRIAAKIRRKKAIKKRQRRAKSHR